MNASVYLFWQSCIGAIVFSDTLNKFVEAFVVAELRTFKHEPFFVGDSGRGQAYTVGPTTTNSVAASLLRFTIVRDVRM